MTSEVVAVVVVAVVVEEEVVAGWTNCSEHILSAEDNLGFPHIRTVVDTSVESGFKREGYL